MGYLSSIKKLQNRQYDMETHRQFYNTEEVQKRQDEWKKEKAKEPQKQEPKKNIEIPQPNNAITLNVPPKFGETIIPTIKKTTPFKLDTTPKVQHTAVAPSYNKSVPMPSVGFSDFRKTEQDNKPKHTEIYGDYDVARQNTLNAIRNSDRTLLDDIKDLGGKVANAYGNYGKNLYRSMGLDEDTVNKVTAPVTDATEYWNKALPHIDYTSANLSKGLAQWQRGIEGVKSFEGAGVGATNPYADENIRKLDAFTNTVDEQKNTNIGGLQKFYGDMLSSIGNMAPSIATGLLNPALGKTMFGVSAGGNNALEAKQAGASVPKALTYGALGAGLELGTEALFGLYNPLFKGSFDNLIEGAIKGGIKSTAGQTLAKYIAGMAGEGTEEVISGLIDPWLKKMTYAPDHEVDYSGLLNDFLMGGAVSGVLGAPGAVLDYADNRSQTNQPTTEPTQPMPQQSTEPITESPQQSTIPQVTQGVVGKSTPVNTETVIQRAIDNQNSVIEDLQNQSYTYGTDVSQDMNIANQRLTHLNNLLQNEQQKKQQAELDRQAKIEETQRFRQMEEGQIPQEYTEQLQQLQNQPQPEIKPLEPVNTQSNVNTQPQAENTAGEQIGNAEPQPITNEAPKQLWQLTKNEFESQTVQRIEEPNVKRATVDKPQGIYTSPANVKSPHEDLGGNKYLWIKNPKAKVLELATDTFRTNRGFVGESAGVASARKFLGDNEVTRLMQTPKKTLVSEMKNKYANVDWNKYYDQQEIVEGYAGLLARENGYDAIFATDKALPEFDEYVALTDNALTHIESHESIIKQALSEGKTVPQEVLKDYPGLQQPVQRESTNKVTLKNLGEVEIIEETDNLVKVKNKLGTIIPIGKKAFENLKIETEQPQVSQQETQSNTEPQAEIIPQDDVIIQEETKPIVEETPQTNEQVEQPTTETPPTEPQTYRYYATQRPPSPGAQPSGTTTITSFDTKQNIDGVDAWGYVEYDKPLTAKQINDYELTEAQSTLQEDNTNTEKTTEPKQADEKTDTKQVENIEENEEKRKEFEDTVEELAEQGKAKRIKEPKSNKDRLTNALIDNEINEDNIEFATPRSKKHGFDLRQREQIASKLIEGSKTDNKTITVDVYDDGTLEIINNEEVIAQVLNSLGISKKQASIPNKIKQYFKKTESLLKDTKDGITFITDGYVGVVIEEDGISTLLELRNEEGTKSANGMLVKRIDKINNSKDKVELTETPKKLVHPAKSKTGNIESYVFKNGETFLQINKKMFDMLNDDGAKFYVEKGNGTSDVLVTNEDGSLKGIILPMISAVTNEEQYNKLNPATGKNFYSKNVKPKKSTKQKVNSMPAQALTGQYPQMPKGDNSTTGKTKTVDDIVSIIEKKIGVPIRTGKFRQKALGIFKIVPEVIRSKVRNDISTISHEVGHYLDKKHSFSNNTAYDTELMSLGRVTSRPSYTNEQVRKEGVAEFVRLYLTNPSALQSLAPNFLNYFESVLDSNTIQILSEVRYDVMRVNNLPNNEKIYNDVSSGESRKSTSEKVNIFKKLYDQWINDKGPFKRIQQYAKERGWTGKDIDILTQIYSGFEAKAYSMLNDNQKDLNGKNIGPSLQAILKPISKKDIKKRKGNFIQETKDFISYMVARRAMDYKDRGLVMPQPFYIYEDNIISMERKYQHFENLFENLRKWEDNNLQLLVDAGIKTQEQIDNIKLMNANHIPLYRIQEAVDVIRGGTGNTLGQSKKVIKHAKGSGATIIDPIESMIVDSFIIRRAAESNNTLKILKEMADDLDGLGVKVEEVTPGMRQSQFSVNEIKAQLKKIAQDTGNTQLEQSIDSLTDVELESMLSIFRPLYMEKDGEVIIYDDGKPLLLKVEPELYKAIKGLTKQQNNFIIRALNVPKKILQTGAVTTVEFIMRNMMRDTISSSIQSNAGVNPLHILKGYYSAMVKDKWFKEWVSSGAASEFLNINERTQAQAIEDNILGYTFGDKISRLVDTLKELKTNNNERTRDKVYNAFKSVVRTPFDMINEGMTFSEAGPRVAEFRKAIEDGTDKDTAAAWARELSQDFLRGGYYGKEYNKITAFFNANIQGTVRIAETFKKHPIRTLVRGLTYVTPLSLLLYGFNHDDEDYQQLADWRKDLYWNIPIGNGKFLSLPKPYGYGYIFGTLPEIMLDKLLHDDPDSFKRTMEGFAQHFSIPLAISAFRPAIDVWANKSWTKAPIESTGDKNTHAYLRRNNRTSTSAKTLSDIFKNERGLSPKQIDYLVKGYTGAVGDFFWRLPDTIKNAKDTPTDITDYPIIKSFVTDSAYASDSVNKLYNYGVELGTRNKAFKETDVYKGMEHLPEDLQLDLYINGLEPARKEYNDIAEYFSDSRKLIREIESSDELTAEDKKEELRNIQKEMNEFAADFNKKYEEFKQNSSIK